MKICHGTVQVEEPQLAPAAAAEAAARALLAVAVAAVQVAEPAAGGFSQPAGAE